MATDFKIEDGNENICGACRTSGILICCENCPAAFHPQCAGYRDVDHVPDGDWFCFSCSKKLKVPYLVKGIYSAEIGEAVFVMKDEYGEVYRKGTVTKIDEEAVTVSYGEENETVKLDDVRLWHGTTEERAWTDTPENEYRPNCRAFEIDYRRLADLGSGSQSVGSDYVEFLSKKKAEAEEVHFLKLLTHFWRVQLKMDGIQWPSIGYLTPLSSLWYSTSCSAQNVMTGRNLVQKRGGFRAVCDNKEWSAIGEELAPGADIHQFAFILKHTYQTVLLDVETNGGVEKMEMLYKYAPVPTDPIGDDLDRRSDEEPAFKRRKRERTKRRPRFPCGEDWIGQKPAKDVFDRTWPKVYSANRAVQEYRSAIGIVALTAAAKGLRVGDKVDVRIYRDSSLGPWRAARILTIATASAFEGYRRFRVKFCKSKDVKEFPTPPEEWVTLLARPSAWGTTLPKPSVLVRFPVKPYFPPVKPAVASGHSEGDRVEAWLYNGWWPAQIEKIDGDRAVLQGDVIPLGEGLRWVSTLEYIRCVPEGEKDGFAMIEPLSKHESLYPKEMEKKLNVTLDTTDDGHLIMSFSRIEDRPSGSRKK